MTEEQEKDPLFLTALYMILFYLVFVLAGYVLIGLGIIQVVVRLLSGQPQDELKRFGAGFGRYMSQIVDYISMKSDVKPYPFSEWPIVTEKKK
ncbi:DUF4389 domain-containing protein [Ketobacter sp.]|uniref:DUF4389 domain-containing protein n=1 Tax=Ketobacter sp. TaxID=2083498 RepID=UPI000F117DE4|nr:DUF4389 domain-containing protein [Ketobacter sp.]RLT98603.1 MAG: DUF4389 domain-containing protein [Ketobacter sp.]